MRVGNITHTLSLSLSLSSCFKWCSGCIYPERLFAARYYTVVRINRLFDFDVYVYIFRFNYICIYIYIFFRNKLEISGVIEGLIQRPFFILEDFAIYLSVDVFRVIFAFEGTLLLKNLILVENEREKKHTDENIDAF